jgi:hypothetical protein
MSVEVWQADTDRGISKYWENSLSQYHYVPHRCGKDCPGIEHRYWPAEPRYTPQAGCVSSHITDKSKVVSDVNQAPQYEAYGG